MNLIQTLFDKLFVKQWTIGVANINPVDFEKKGIDGINFHWINIDRTDTFYADPFVFKSSDGKIHIVYEDYTYGSFGKISMKILDEKFNTLETKRLLNTGSHLSYPSVLTKGGKTFILPESGLAKNLYCFEYDFTEKKLINQKTVIPNEPLLDSTILEHNGKYWLFANKRGFHSNSYLYIYYSDCWDKGYVPHKKNPVKKKINGSRPAGNFIKIGNNIYRPAQNSKEYYGKSIAINKLVSLNEEEFVEEHLFDICPPQNTKFKFAIHTINISDDVIVVDGLRRIFNPLIQIKSFFYKTLNIKHVE